MFILDLILYKILLMFCPDEQPERLSSKENSANWIILDDLEQDGKLDNKSNDPFLNGEYEKTPFENGDYNDFDGGPDW